MARVRAAPAGANTRKIGVARQRDIVAPLSLVNKPADDGADSPDDTYCAVDCPAQAEYLGWHPYPWHFQCHGVHRYRNGTRDATITALSVIGVSQGHL